jgi:hypothetical protein
MKSFLLSLISATHGQGPSSTRLVYLMNGVGAAFCALVMTIGGIEVYYVRGDADAVYWGCVAALWTATLGFGSKSKDHQQTQAKERERARGQEIVPAMSGD